MSNCTSTADAGETAPALPLRSNVGDVAWLAVYSLALTVFGLVMAEFLPASLLTPIASSLGVSEGAAGQAVTATAVIAAIAGLAIPVATSRFDRRVVMLSLTVLLIASSLMAAAATNLPMLLAARIVLGISLGGFWSMSAALILRLVPGDLVPRAMAVFFTGVSVATVCAAPIGAYVGHLWGWRSVFLLAAIVGALALLAQIVTLPRMPSHGATSLRTLAGLLRRPSIRIAMLTVLALISGHFAGFTYSRPFLEQVTGFGVEEISLTLLAFGVAGFFGNIAGGFIAERSIAADIGFGAFVIALSTLALALFGSSALIAALAVTAWGFAFGAIPVGVQSWIVRAAPDEAEGAGGLLVAAFQVAIALGAMIGGLLVDGMGVVGTVSYAALATLAGAVLVLSFAATIRGSSERSGSAREPAPSAAR